MVANANIKPYKVCVPDVNLESLKAKLAMTTWPCKSELSNDWAYGSPLNDVQRLAKYWATGFDWRKQEAEINKLPQFTTKVSLNGFGEFDIHFIHKASNRAGAIPLLFCHGCELASCFNSV